MSSSGQDRVKAGHYASTHPALMMCFFLAAFGCLQWARQHYDFSGVSTVRQRIVLGMCLATALFYGLKWAHTVWFTPEGLEFRFLFWKYRFLLWSRVSQVGTAKEYKATRPTLVITPEGSPAFDTASKQRTVYVERNYFRLIRLDATRQNLQALTRFYGPLDYETEKW